MIGLWADDDLRLLKMLEVHRLKTRDSVGDTKYSEFAISWDLETMRFGELSTETDDIVGDSHEVAL